MDYIKISKVSDVALFRRGKSSRGTLHLTTHHMIFQLEGSNPHEQADRVAGGVSDDVAALDLNRDARRDGARNDTNDIGNVTNGGKAVVGDANTDGTNDTSNDINTVSDKNDMTDNKNGNSGNTTSDKNDSGNTTSDNTSNTASSNTASSTSSPSSTEIWISYPIISSVEKKNGVIRIRCRDFTYLALHFHNEPEAKDVFDSIQKLCCPPSVDRLYAFFYKPGKSERRFNGWAAFNPQQEFGRQGAFAKNKWRLTALNENYALCATYPQLLSVPTSVSDNVLNYAARFRSKNRLPVLSFHNSFNGCTIARCSQPLVGLKKNRSPQDEKVVAEIFGTTVNSEYETPRENLIVDARPVANAVAQQALGAGSENTDNYARGSCTKHYLGIDNIHVMRDSLNKVTDVLKDGDYSELDYASKKDALQKSGWLKYTTIILEGAVLMAKALHLEFKHVLLHCSDGWDRTAQLSCLAQIMVDPYFRTLNGFMVLVEKEWLAFGHQFNERSGHLNGPRSFVDLTTSQKPASQSNAFSDFMSAARAATQAATQAATSSNHLKNTSPVFHQFLDCVYQLVRQFPDRFEYSERFLRRLYYHLHSGQYGTFLYDNEKERVQNRVFERTTSVWNYFLARRSQFINPNYNGEAEMKLSATLDALILPDVDKVTWWFQLFGIEEADVAVEIEATETAATPVLTAKAATEGVPAMESEAKEEATSASPDEAGEGSSESSGAAVSDSSPASTTGSVPSDEEPVEQGDPLGDVTPRTRVLEKKRVLIQPLSNTSVEYSSFE
ncbi:Phosphoinositide 3-phosphatase [Yarrowia sp. C11]|nr:Phosphoinositide 3-phosphatase [Yarrowia sp. C11]KAG5370830.1 Phosphoinositide 3-phosphatase [Yarrowia sp. E02]